jgi:putative membrane protein
MTYTEFLLYFTVIPIIILAFILRNDLEKSHILTLLLVSVIAFAATALWDNFAVYSGIWMFPRDKTLGIYFGYVPLEEYLFFFLQTYLTGLVQLYCLFKVRFFRKQSVSEIKLRTILFPLIILASIVNFWERTNEPFKLPFGNWNYLFHLFSWAGLFVLIQYAFGRKKITQNFRLILIPTLVMTAYFSLADSISIGNGIWSFDPMQTIGTKIGNVPLEEILFFFMTNLLITEAMVLFLNQKHLNAKIKN